MKNLIELLFFVLLVIIYSCGGGTTSDIDESDKESGKELKSEKKGKSSSEVIKDCDDFLDRYEEWITLYIKVLKDYKKNPYDSKAMVKYSEAMQEAATWAQDWANLSTCIYNKKYQKRFEEIAEKANKELEELGFE